MKKILTLFTVLILFGSMTVVQADTWTVAGDNTTILGSGTWNTENTDNDMINVNGSNWYLLKANKTLTGGTLKYKVAKDHAWTTAYPGSDRSFTLTAGTYDVLFKFDSNSHDVSEAKVTTWTVAGTQTVWGSNWNTEDTENDMTRSSDNWTFTKSHVLLATGNTYECKVAANHVWTYAFPGENKTFSVTEDGYYDVTVDFNTSTLEVTVTTTFIEPAVPPTPVITLHSNIKNPSWETSAEFALAGNEETASLTLTGVTKGSYEFGLKIDGTWTSNGTAFTRANNSHAVVAGSGNCTFNADRNGNYTFTWTYATNTLEIGYPAIPAQSVSITGLASQILKGTAVTFTASSSGIDDPGYRFYVKEKNGEYGSAVTSYTFNAVGEYKVKVEALEYNTGTPVATDESDVVVYEEHTFTAGTRIYVDFSAMTEGTKGVNYPKNYEVGLDYDANGAGTFKTIRFSANVTWSSLAEAFIKTEKAGWAGLKFTAPGEGQNKIVVAADGASYTWGSYTPATVQVKFFAPRDESNNWDHIYAHSWDAAGNITEWPGVEITSSKANLWYAYAVQVGANVLFHNNAGMQTADIEDIQVAACYEPTAIDYNVDPKIVTVTANAGCEIAYYIAGSKDLVGGTADWQINLPLDDENKIVFQNVDPGTYAFKINNNSWAWSIGGYDHLKGGDCATIAQTVGEGDLGFKIDTKQDVTVTYYPETQEICLGAETVKQTTTISADDISIKAGESKAVSFTTNNTENPNVTYNVESGADCICLFKGVITGIKAGMAVVSVSLSETANYTAASTNFTITIANPVAPAQAIETVGGKFVINAKGDTAVFARGNLKYNVATEQWYCADHQYDFVGENGNLHFGDANYKGEYDLFGWSSTASNYGLMQSNHDDVYTGAFVDWGGLFTGGGQEWSTLTGSEWSYIINHHQWTIMALDPTPEDATNEDEIYGLAIFPLGWVQPAGFDDLTYSYCDWWDEVTIAKNTFALSKWSELEAAGAVFLPHAGARAGHWGNTWSGKAETTTKNSNPNGGLSYCFVDNIGWYGYYWSSTTDPRSEHPYDAHYLITPGWSEGPTEADEDDLYLPPVVWSREKRRGNSVRLVTRIPKAEFEDIRTGLTAGKYYTVCWNKTMVEIRGASLWSFIGKDVDFAYIQEESAPYPAGKPFIVYAESEKLEAILAGAEVTAPNNVGTNGLYGTFAQLEQNNFDDIASTTGKDVYFIYNEDGQPSKLRKVNGQTGNWIRAYRAYVIVADITGGKPASAPGKKVRSMPMQKDAAQGIEDVQGDNVQSTKVLINGNLYILRGEKVYDATGRLVK